MKIAVLVSGGVDSSVALALLKDQGYDITAFYIKIWLEDELSYLGNCPWEEDLYYVMSVCKQLSVPLEIISLQKEYLQEVVGSALLEIKLGKTPNPDILCNQRIKFGAFYKYIGSSFDLVATGHYAQKIKSEDEFLLVRSSDKIKDQTYFLSQISQEQLAKAIFPIGCYADKSEIRALANNFNLANKDRKDSQGICFLGKLKFSDFLRHHIGDQEGDLIEHETGKKIGVHKGFWYYTIGQRQGLGLAGGPWYVVSKNTQENKIFISRNYYSDDKTRDTFYITDCSWITKPIVCGKEYLVKLRHGAYDHNCVVMSSDNLNLGDYKIKLSSCDQGIAKGQFAVFYDNQICLGGGIIN